MKKTRIGMIAACLLLPAYTVAHDGECSGKDEAIAHLATVESAITSASFTGNPRKNKGGDFERDNLLGKALAAKSYIHDHKYSDAMSKLDDIVTKVSGLLDAPKEKVDPYDGAHIVDATIDAMYCVGDLQ